MGLRRKLARAFFGFRTMAWIAGLWCIFACSGGSQFVGTSPPLDIPLPISNLMTVVGPDAEGNVRVTGAPGAVLPGAGVRVSLLATAGASLRPGFSWIASAWAQDAATESQAGADGSFQLTLRAKIGDVLRVVQIVSGAESPPVDLTVTGKALPLPVFPKALELRPAQDELVVAGSLGDEAQLLRLALEPLPGSFPEPLVTLPQFSGISGLALESDSELAFAVSAADGGLYRIALDASEPPALTPLPGALSVDVSSDNGFAVIGGEGVPSLRFFDIATGQQTCVVSLVHPERPELPALRVPYLAVVPPSPGPHVRLVIVAQFSDLSWALLERQIHSQTCNVTVNNYAVLPELREPGALAASGDGTVAWVSDRGGDRVFRVEWASGSVAAVEVGEAPLGLALDEARGALWVVLQGENALARVALDDLSVRRRDGVGLSPSHLVVEAVRDRALVLSETDRSLLLLDLDF